jgi:hypothetical protein
MYPFHGQASGKRIVVKTGWLHQLRANRSKGRKLSSFGEWLGKITIVNFIKLLNHITKVLPAQFRTGCRPASGEPVRPHRRQALYLSLFSAAGPADL